MKNKFIGHKLAFSNFVVSLLVSLMLNGCAFKTIYCGPGDKENPVTIVKNPDRAYRKYDWARSFDAAVQGSVTALNGIKVDDASVSVKNSIDNFREKISNETVRMQTLVRSNSRAFNSAPCFEDVRKEFFAFQNKMADKTAEFEKLRIELTKLAEGSGAANEDANKVLRIISEFENNYDYTEDSEVSN